MNGSVEGKSDAQGGSKYYFGVTRFSLFSPDSRAWRLSRQSGASDPDEYRKRLFSDERMAPRMQIFRDIAAPIYQQMALRHNYSHFVYYSPELPEKWKAALKDASKAYPVLKLIDTGEPKTDASSRIRNLLSESEEGESALVYSFRVDDDDLVSADYLDQVDAYMKDEFVGFAVAFGSGFAGLFENGAYSKFATYSDTLLAIGQGAIGKWHSGEGRLDLDHVFSNHRRTHFGRTVLLNAQRPTFFYTWHGEQDTHVQEGATGNRNGGTAEERRGAISRRFHKLDVLDDPSVTFQRFPGLAEHVRG